MTPKELKKLIGQKVEWDEGNVSPRFREFLITKSGIVQEVTGRNVLINGDYKWIPHLKNLRKAK